MTGSFVQKIAKKAGIELTAGKAARRFPAETREKVIEALKVTPNGSQVGRQLGVDIHRVARIAKAEGITLSRYVPHDTRKLPAEKRTAVVEALKINPSGPQVSRVTGVSEATVRKIAKEESITLPRGGPKRSNQQW